MSREAMKLALEALELSAVTVDSFGVQQKTHEAITSLREALAEQQQEPVTWMEMVVANLVREGVNKHKARELAQHFYTSPPAQQEPVACANGCRGFVKHSPPAQRTWVGLTDEETGHWAADFLAGAKWAEAKLLEKNNG